MKTVLWAFAGTADVWLAFWIGDMIGVTPGGPWYSVPWVTTHLIIVCVCCAASIYEATK